VPLLEVVDLHKIYTMGDTEVRALDGVSLSVESGEFIAVMGSSGSGKSTLMNLLGCLDRPTSGHYVLRGERVSDLNRDELANARNRLIGFVFQGFHLLARTSALENVELPLLYAGVSGKERHRRSRKALELVGLGDRMDHHPNQMSGGQQQRVAIARAIVTEPGLLLADEPTGNLDTRNSHEIMGIFQKLSDTGMTIVLVTHESDVAAWARRIVWMRDGHVLSDEPHEPGSPVHPPPIDPGLSLGVP
jgi:putative ABC transport system ATP-binding protein